MWSLPVVGAFASALLLAGLGGLVLAMRPRHATNTFFGLFALIWGLQLAAGNLARGTGWIAMAWLAYPLRLPAYVFLGQFISVFPRPGLGAWPRWIGRTFVVAALAATVLFVGRPDLLVERLVETPQGFQPQYGPLGVPLLEVPKFVGLELGALVLYLTWTRANGAFRHQTRLLVAGFLLYVSYISVADLAPLIMDPQLVARLAAGTGILAACFVGGAALMVALATHAAWRGSPDGAHRLIVAAAIVPGAVAAAEAGLVAISAVSVQTLGIWRTAMVAFVLYAIARHQLFDIDLRIRRSVARGAVIAVLAGLAFVAAQTLEQLVPTQDLAQGIAVGAVIAVAFLPARKAASWIAHRLIPHARTTPSRLAARKEDVYRLAVQHLITEHAAEPEAKRTLAALRGSLELEPGRAGELEEEARRMAAPAMTAQAKRAPTA